MQIVIDIPENFYKGVKVVAEESEDITEEIVTLPMECIANGIPLPEHHGKLKDVDKIIAELGCSDEDIIFEEILREASTVIEASGEE